MNKLTEEGRRARRALLLATLERHAWRLTDAGIELGFGVLDAATLVLRAIRVHGLRREYDAAKAAGKIVRGGHRVRSIDQRNREAEKGTG